MIWIQLSVTLCVLSLGVWADIAGGQNGYLPPQKGYNYPVPSKPFPTPTRPGPPPTRPTSQPFGTRPPIQPPTRPPLPPTITPFRPPPPPGPTRPPYRPTAPPLSPSTYLPPSRPSKPYRPTPPPVRPTTPYVPPRPTQPDLTGGPSDQHPDHHHHEHHHEPGMPFDFTYSVNDVEHGNDYSHNAVSDGDVTTGQYRVQLPDGRVQVVKYTADWKHGFHAQVTYEGQPTYPKYQGSASNQGYKY